MAPKSKKAIDEPPANSTRAKTGTSSTDQKSTSGRKHTTDLFDGEIADNAEKVVPRAKVPKEKTAKQAAEVDADTKPSKHDDPLLEPGEDNLVGNVGEAKQAAPIKAKKGRPSKGETIKEDDANASTKPEKAKKGRPTKDDSAKAAEGGAIVVSAKAKKGRPTKGETDHEDDTNAFKKPEKAKKGRPTKGETANEDGAGDFAASTGKRDDEVIVAEAVGSGMKDKSTKPTKSKNSKVAKKEAAKSDEADDHHVETEKTYPGGDRVEVEPPKPAKRRKGTARGGETVAGLSTQSKKPERKAKVSQDSVDNNDSIAEPNDVVDHPGSEPSKSNKTATKAVKSKSAKKATASKMDSGDRSEVAENTVGTEPQKKGRGTKALSAKDKDKNQDANIDPEMAMDDSVFDTLLSTVKGKEALEEADSYREQPEPAKASKKANKEPTSKVVTKPKMKIQDTSKEAQSAGATSSKSKKRKTPADGDVEAVKTDVLDPLSEMASAKKKQRKSEPSALEAMGSYIGSTVDSAKKKAKAVIGYAGDVAGGAQDSIMGDVTSVAEGAVEEKTKKKRSKVDPNYTTDQELDKVDSELENNEEADDNNNSFGDTSFLKGFESSGDERDGSDIDFPADKSIPSLPPDTQSAALAASKTATKSPGYIYVGRIPHGFYEHQMRAYFSQFGHITNLRLSRNKTTGRSKHFAFLEFESEEVAKIVASTMHNYLLFGHILKVKLIPKEQLHPDAFKGANKRFVSVPWAQIQGRELAMPVDRETWEKRVGKEREKRGKKAEKAKEIGYEFEASLKGVDSVPVRKGRGKKEVEDAMVEEEEQTLITGEDKDGGSMVVAEVKKVKKVKGKGKEIVTGATATTTAVVKKGKRKAEESLEKAGDAAADVPGSVIEPVVKKVKKAKDKAAKSKGE